MIVNKSSTAVHLDWASKQIPLDIGVGKLWNLAVSASIIRLLKNERFLQFSHQLIQEHLAAVYLSRRPELIKQYLKPPKFYKSERLAQPFDEVVYSLTGLDHEEEFIDIILKSDPFLAFDTFKKTHFEHRKYKLLENNIILSLMYFFNHGSASSQQAASRTIVQFENHAVEHLKQTLESKNPKTRRLALASLGQIKSLPSIRCVVNSLLDDYRWLRKDAISIIHSFDYEQQAILTRYVKDILPKESKERKKQIGKKLLDCIPDNNLEIPLLISETAEIYLKIERLNLQEDKSNELALINNLIIQLGHLEPGKGKPIINKLGLMGSSALMPLLFALRSENVEIRRRIPRALALMKDSHANTHLRLACRDPESRVRAEAIRALGILNDFESSQIALDLVNDPDYEVLSQALLTLGNLRHPMCSEIARDFLEHANSYVRFHALLALDRTDDSDILELAHRMSDDPIEEVRDIALKILDRRGTSRITDTLS